MNSNVSSVTAPIERLGWRLLKQVNVNGEHEPAFAGDEMLDFKNRKLTLLGGTPPHKPSSTGRIQVIDEDGWEAEYFPEIAYCKWVRE